MRTVYTNLSKVEVLKRLRNIPQAILRGGYRSDAMMQKVGLEALACISEAFRIKAAGGTDAAGERWAALQPATVAYKRKHPGLPSPSVRALYRPSYALSKNEREDWWEAYRNALNKQRRNGDDEDYSLAARKAWKAVKDNGAKTLLDKYGGVAVPILRDTDALFDSLTPKSGSKEQIFRVHNGEVEVGTNRQGATRQNKKRRLWPNPRHWPSAWNRRLLAEARLGLLDLVVGLVT